MSDREQWLVGRAATDAEAFRELYNSYLPRVYAYVAYRVGSAADAEDITADVFLKVVSELGGFRWRHDNSFAAWVFRIAHNLVSNFHRGASRHAPSLTLDELPEIAVDELLPEDALLRKEQFARLRAVVAALPERRREVVMLRYFAGLRNNEIANVLGIGERTVASTLSRALDDLQESLREYRVPRGEYGISPQRRRDAEI